MITEAQQDQAALYALGALSTEEVAAFERDMASDTELAALVRDLREAAAAVALSVPQQTPPIAVKSRVMAEIRGAAPAAPAELVSNIVPMPEPAPRANPFNTWVPWAIAAGLVIFCGVLLNDRAELERRVADMTEPLPTPSVLPAVPPVLVALAPAPDGPPGAQAVVAWEPATQTGTIKINKMPAVAAGQDYQLWAVDATHPDPISAGVIRVDANGVAQVQFKPVQAAHDVKAFAISLEREGGVPKKEGPILLVGTT